MGILLGCIADDFTGASRLAGLLARSGVAVNLRFGTPTIPPVPDAPTDGSVVAPFEVIALDRRTDAADAATAALGAWAWLAHHGARRCHWSYGSAFDAGTVGAVADALLDVLRETIEDGPRVTVHVPACPGNRRMLHRSRPFVDGVPSDGSPVRGNGHAAPPARRTPGAVARLSSVTVRAGHRAIRDDIGRLARDGAVHVVADAIADTDLVELVRGTEALPLLCGGSAFASHLPALYRVRGWLPRDAPGSAGRCR